jgi:hypothetical protein
VAFYAKRSHAGTYLEGSLASQRPKSPANSTIARAIVEINGCESIRDAVESSEVSIGMARLTLRSCVHRIDVLGYGLRNACRRAPIRARPSAKCITTFCDRRRHHHRRPNDPSSSGALSSSSCNLRFARPPETRRATLKETLKLYLIVFLNRGIERVGSPD